MKQMQLNATYRLKRRAVTCGGSSARRGDIFTLAALPSDNMHDRHGAMLKRVTDGLTVEINGGDLNYFFSRCR